MQTADGKIATRLERMRLADLRLLELNARFMRHEQFARLVENIRRDGALTSVPLVVREDDGGFRVLSGNHRVSAAIEAGILEADVMVIDGDLPEARRIALQLSHNAIAGEDDPDILRKLYEKIEDVDWKAYSGLDDQILSLLTEIAPPTIPQARLDFQLITLVFLPEEVEAAKETLKSAIQMTKADETWLARFSEYDRWLDTLDEISSAHNVGNVATCVVLLLAAFERHREDLREGYLTSDGEVLHNGWVPLSSVFGTSKVPSKVAAKLCKAVDRLTGEHDLSKGERWKALEVLAEGCLNA